MANPIDGRHPPYNPEYYVFGMQSEYRNQHNPYYEDYQVENQNLKDVDDSKEVEEKKQSYIPGKWQVINILANGAFAFHQGFESIMSRGLSLGCLIENPDFLLAERLKHTFLGSMHALSSNELLSRESFSIIYQAFVRNVPIISWVASLNDVYQVTKKSFSNIEYCWNNLSAFNAAKYTAVYSANIALSVVNLYANTMRHYDLLNSYQFIKDIKIDTDNALEELSSGNLEGSLKEVKEQVKKQKPFQEMVASEKRSKSDPRCRVESSLEPTCPNHAFRIIETTPKNACSSVNGWSLNNFINKYMPSFISGLSAEDSEKISKARQTIVQECSRNAEKVSTAQ